VRGDDEPLPLKNGIADGSNALSDHQCRTVWVRSARWVCQVRRMR
jgi:hypothetical protein